MLQWKRHITTSKMRVSDSWCFFLLCISFFTICSCKSGFILTSPKVLDEGSTEHFNLALFDVPANGTAFLSLRSKRDDRIIAHSVVSTSNGYTQIAMEIPQVPDSEAWLQINGTFLGEKETSQRKLVKIRHKTVTTFLQTDKPIYKPGQTVRFRIFPLDSQLKPLNKDALGDVWMEDPGSVRIAQWKNVNFSLGIIQLELPLSEEPVLGVWSIKTVVNGFSHSQNFTVAEYVLPKYEVKIKAPKRLLKSRIAEPFPIEVCAQYTYGKKVNGLLNLTLVAASCSWRYSSSCERYSLINRTEVISGCHTFHVKPHLSDNALLLEVFSEVTEIGTDVKQNASTKITITGTTLQMNFLGFEKGNRFYKPGLPFYETLRVISSENSIPSGLNVQVCHTLKSNFTKPEVCERYTTDERGEVSFSIPRSFPAYHQMELKAKTTGEGNGQQSKNVVLKAWFSSSGSYLQIHPIYKEVECGKLQQVKIHYTTHNGSTNNFYYQVMSKGRIVQLGSHFHTALFFDEPREEPVLDDSSTNVHNVKLLPYIGEFNLTFDARPSISPVARLLVFYVRSDGEVVSDSREFDLAHCLLNEANLGFRSQTQYPSTVAEVLLSASPFSHCGVGIVDKSVHLMNPEKQISKEKVFTLLKGYDVDGSTAPLQTSREEDYCREPDYGISRDVIRRLGRRSIFPRRGRRYFFIRSYRDKHVDSIIAFDNAGVVIISNFAIETRPCHKESTKVWHRAGYFRSSSRDKSTSFVRRLLPEYDEGFVTTPGKRPAREEQPPKSVAEIRRYFPETWLWELHAVGENGEVVFNRTLPDTVTEWVGSAVCVHPVAGLGISDMARVTTFQPFFISFTLPYSAIRDEVVPVIITVFNYLTDCLPIKLSLEPNEDYAVVRESRTQKLCVCGGESKSHRFHIRPVTLGRVNITVYGYSLEDDTICGNNAAAKLTARDAVTRQLLIEAEGFPKEEIFNHYFCPGDNNGTFSTKTDLMLPANAIQGSARAYFTVVGDIMGPALSNLDKLVQLPTGCGEQNMIRFVPNIFVLDYLTASGKVTEKIKSTAMIHMETGYQRELRYRHKDGSYSAFGGNDKEGSLWLTAFVVRSFSHARRFITIDENDLTRSTQWIVKQQFKNGCFRRVGTVLHTEMKGGLSHGGKSLVPLTAYVLIALLEADVTDMEVVTNAMMCLQSDTNPTAYSLSLFAYAAALAKDPKAQKYLKQLENRAIRNGNEMYWKSVNESSRSVDIETGAYAVLAMLEAGGQNNVPQVLPIVRWITKQRNSNGGFVSTQDTVIALQALAKYATLISQNQVNIETVIRSKELLRSFTVNESNMLVTQSVKFPIVPTVVELQATGDGCALAQFTLRYNVQFNTGSEAFDLNVTSSQNGSDICNKPTIGICIRYKIPKETSNMVVVTVKMISGYIPDKTSVKKLYEDSTLALKRHDVDGSKIHFYFSELTNERKCFRFLTRNEFKVENVKPATVKLYDYYQTEMEITKNYEIPATCISPTQS